MCHSTDSGIDIKAFQISNEGATIVKENLVKPAKDPLYLRVKKSHGNYLYPEISYFTKNEYDRDVIRKADPYLPTYHLIISLRHSFPKDPNPSFKSNSFAATLDINWNEVKAHTNQRGKVFYNRLLDFNLYMALGLNIGVEHPLVIGISELFKTGEASERELSQLLEELYEEFQPDIEQGDNALIEFVNQVMLMGFDEQQAREAAFVTGCSSVEAAINYILNA